MRVRLNVTEADITNGTRNSYRSCPIAKALGRRFNDVRVTNIRVDFTGRNGQRYTAKLTGVAKAFVKAVDRVSEDTPIPFRTVLTATAIG